MSLTAPKFINISTESDTIVFDSKEINTYKILGNSHLNNKDIDILLYKINLEDNQKILNTGENDFLYLTKNIDNTY